MTLDQSASEFIEENIGLLHKFMQRYSLDEDYYGLLAICYIKAATKYLSDPQLQRYEFSTILWYRLRYEFSTILWYRLRYEISHARRKERKQIQTVSLERTVEPQVFMDEESDSLLWKTLESILTSRQLEVLYLRYRGMTNREIAEQFGISQVAVERLFSRIRKRFTENYT